MSVCGSQMMLAYSRIGRRPLLVLCKLGVWFCVGMCECFCGGRLKSCLLSVHEQVKKVTFILWIT